MKTISLKEAKNIKIFKRFESKYVLINNEIDKIIDILDKDYYVVEDNGKALFSYHSLYFDTNHLDMWRDHNNDEDFRQKIRIREYEDNEKFLEIKEKNNGITEKIRIPVYSYNINDEINWVSHNLKYDTKNLIKSLDIKYYRMSFIKKDKTERITLDVGLEYYNYKTNKSYKYDNIKLAVLEIKKNKNDNNELENILNEKFLLYKRKFSKYHEGIKHTIN